MMQQIREAMKIIHTAFVTVERQQMRNALKYGKANGWIAAEARAPQFPWADVPYFVDRPLTNEVINRLHHEGYFISFTETRA